MATKGKKEAIKKQDTKWENSVIQTHEKPKVRKCLTDMQLPTFDENLDSQMLQKISDSVCLQLSLKD